MPKVLSNEGTQRAISWFRSTANEPIQKVRDMAALLEVNDVHVRMVKTNDPGTVIYEDDWQVVAVPRKRKKRK
ncbi:MAG TPA: hypothetical protein PKN33_10175 [Phycisphaerae bacterium]|nr:hypothetical protein [Phycisphaerae bacterium]